MDTRKNDVVVVGGGIIGLACAYFLAKDGVRTLLIERGLPGAEQSVRTGGGIRLCHSSVLNVQLSKLSFPIWEQFQERFGFDPRFTPIGHLFLARSGTSAETLRTQTRLHAQLDVSSEYLALEDINGRWQDLRLTSYEGGVFCSMGGYLDHHRAVQGFYHGWCAPAAWGASDGLRQIWRAGCWCRDDRGYLSC